MATTEFSTGKTVFVLAIVIVCFALLWPRIFHPMVQNSVPIPQNDLYAQNRPSSGGCCDVVYDYDIDNNFFARLCEILVQREEGDEDDVKSHTKQVKSDTIQQKKPGVRQMCQEKVLEMCQVDVGVVLNYDSKTPEYKEAIEQIRSLNVSNCLRRHYEKHEKFTLLAQKMRHRRFMKNKITEKWKIKSQQIRSASPIHPALRERVPMATRIRESHSHKSKMESVMPPRLAAGTTAFPRPSPSVPVKGGTTTGSMGFIMPMYTIGIVVFFIYTVMKVMFRARGDDSHSTISAFHADPDYRKYVLGQDYTGSGEILSYNEFLRGKEREEKLKYNIIQDDDRKLMFTAIQGIVAEMDEFREQMIKDDEIPTISTTCDEEETKQASIAPPEILRDSLQAQMSLEDSDLLPTIHEDAKFAVLGVETTAVFEKSPTPTPRSPTPGRGASPSPFARGPSPRRSPCPSPRHSPPPSPRTPSPQEGERESNLTTPTPETSGSPSPRLAEFVLPENIPNIILDTNIPSDTQLVMSESQSETISQDGEEMDEEEQKGVVIAGKMTISLIDMEANHVESTSGEGNEDEINRKLDLSDLSSDLLTPAAASEETTLEEVTTEEIVTETRTVFETENNKSDEDEEEETESDDSEENPTPPVPKDPLRNVQ